MISIIVPVYKAEDYLRKCIDSILNQSYNNFELILVDDGSPDRSGEICDCYSHLDNRVKVLHKPNGGVSSARNLGLENIQGEWVTFIDSDDWVANDYLKCLIANENEADFTMSYYEAIGWEGWISNPFEDEFYQGAREAELFINKYLISANFICGKLLRSSIIKKFNLRFDEVLKYGEDTDFIYSYIKHSESFRTIHSATYFYNCLNQQSANKKSVNIPVFLNALDALDKRVQDILSQFNILENDIRIKINRLTINRIFHSVTGDKTITSARLLELYNNPIIHGDIIDKTAPKSRGRQIWDFVMKTKCFGLIAFALRIKNSL